MPRRAVIQAWIGRRWLGILICAIQLCGPHYADALLRPSGPDAIVNTLKDSGQFQPDVATLGSASFLVVWAGLQSAVDPYTGIHGQRLSQDGTRVGNEFLINTTFEGDESNEVDPRVRADSEGRAIVVWTNQRDADGSETGVFAQRLDAAGRKVGSEFLINSYTTGEQLAPFVAAGSGGDFVVTWFDGGMFGEFRTDLMARWFGAGGDPVTGDISVANTEQGNPIVPDVEMLSAGHTIIAWQALGIDGDGDGIVGRRYDDQHKAIDDVFQINSASAGDQASVDLTVTASGEIVAVWQGPDQDLSGIFGQRFTQAWERNGAEFQINTYTTGDQRTPRLANSGDGSFVVVWDSEQQDGDAAGVFARLFDPAGRAEGAEFQVNTYTTGDQGDGRLHLAVAANQTGAVVVVWETDEQTGPATDIMARAFCIEGHTGRACADPSCNESGQQSITAGDALLALRNAIGLQRCAPCVCDVDHSNSTTAGDALTILRRAVGQEPDLMCPPCT